MKLSARRLQLDSTCRSQRGQSSFFFHPGATGPTQRHENLLPAERADTLSLPPFLGRYWLQRAAAPPPQAVSAVSESVSLLLCSVRYWKDRAARVLQFPRFFFLCMQRVTFSWNPPPIEYRVMLDKSHGVFCHGATAWHLSASWIAEADEGGLRMLAL